MMFRYDKLILTRASDFIGQGYACNARLFILILTYDVVNNIEYIGFYFYLYC